MSRHDTSLRLFIIGRIRSQLYDDYIKRSCKSLPDEQFSLPQFALRLSPSQRYEHVLAHMLACTTRHGSYTKLSMDDIANLWLDSIG